MFGEDGRVRFVASDHADRFTNLQSRNVDLVAAVATYTMERDVYEVGTLHFAASVKAAVFSHLSLTLQSTAKAGFTFSVPYLYSGLSLAGEPHFVACAEQRSTAVYCTGIRICVQYGTPYVNAVINMVTDSSVIVLAPTIVDFYNNFVRGLCNVLAGDQFDLSESFAQRYFGNYSISNTLYTQEPISLVTRDDDSDWSDYVNWVMLALLSAEQQSVTQAKLQKQ